MKFLTTMTLLATSAAALKNGVTLSGPHGKEYSDMDLVTPGQVVKSITIRTDERVNGVGINFVDPSDQEMNLYHGSGGGDSNTLTLDEYVTGIEAHWGEYHSHTRVRFIQFTTSANNTTPGGTRATKIGSDTAPAGYQLGGFLGTSGVELDSIWTSIAKVD